MHATGVVQGWLAMPRNTRIAAMMSAIENHNASRLPKVGFLRPLRDEADKQEYVTNFKEYSGGGHNGILVGQNWIVFAAEDEVAEVEFFLGGNVVNATS